MARWLRPRRRQSFGTRLIETLGRQLKGNVRLTYEPSGFVYFLDIPLLSLESLSGDQASNVRMSLSLCDRARYACATASLQGWNGSVAPLLVSPSRSTTLGQANFIGMVWIRASS